MCKKVENEFIGVNSGIMDQFAVAKGQKGKAILLDCDSLEHEYIPFETGDYILAVINSRKERKLAESKYNERFAECGQALKLLKQEADIVHLCDLAPGDFEKVKHLFKEPVLEKRARHVVYEQDRVMQAVRALRDGKLSRFGELMYESHHSLRDLYEVSGKELDTIVEFCSGYEGCIGARMTGAGFGGCAIALVKKVSFDDFKEKLTAYYGKEIGYAPEVFSSEAEEGVTEVAL
jgi:galactokinase